MQILGGGWEEDESYFGDICLRSRELESWRTFLKYFSLHYEKCTKVLKSRVLESCFPLRNFSLVIWTRNCALIEFPVQVTSMSWLIIEQFASWNVKLFSSLSFLPLRLVVFGDKLITKNYAKAISRAAMACRNQLNLNKISIHFAYNFFFTLVDDVSEIKN